MAEWLIAAVLKTAVPQGTQSSNLCPSAILIPKNILQKDVFLWNKLPLYRKVAEFESLSLRHRILQTALNKAVFLWKTIENAELYSFIQMWE